MRNQPKYNFFKNSNYAINGFKEILKNESSFKIEIIIFTITTFSLPFWSFETAYLVAILISQSIVLICECLNSAIERSVDLVTKEYNQLAGAAKDAGSAAVMIANITVVIIWILAIIKRFYE